MNKELEMTPNVLVEFFTKASVRVYERGHLSVISMRKIIQMVNFM